MNTEQAIEIFKTTKPCTDMSLNRNSWSSKFSKVLGLYIKSGLNAEQALLYTRKDADLFLDDFYSNLKK